VNASREARASPPAAFKDQPCWFAEDVMPVFR
jgi:hypothetical protein